jgi:hypothetical protein
MSPELERLLIAYHEKRTCPDADKVKRAVAFERLLVEALSRKPGVCRDELLNAISDRYAEFRRQRLKTERERLSRLR